MRMRKLRIITGIFAAVFLVGCAALPDKKQPEKQSAETSDTGFVLTGPGSYDSADTAVVMKIDPEAKTISFLNLIVSRTYTLHYDGTTQFYDRYGQPLSLEQIKEGDIVDLTFLKSKKQLASLMLSPESWSNENVVRYDLSASSRNVTVGEDIYRITSDTRIFSDGREIEMIDLNSTDVLTFRGIDSVVYSIVVEKGHGYLRLSGDENFLGGWIEVGQTMIHQITEDMLLTVPEGSYQVVISVKGGGGTKNVVINRNQEVTLDISDLGIEEVKYGQVVFAMKPANASLYVDGTLVDTSGPVSLEYGIHQLISRAEGYNTMTSYLKVAEESAGIEITLTAEDGKEDNKDDKDGDQEEKKDDDKDDNKEENKDENKEDDKGDNKGDGQDGGKEDNQGDNGKDSQNENKDETVSSGDHLTTTGYYQVHIDAPEGVEIYVDGNYVGIAPVSFKKTEGPHVITLRKSGFITRSYTIELDKEDKDVTFSFAELEKNE